MPLHIAIVAPGSMGSALAHRLTTRGLRVSTFLEGRGARTRARAEAAGMVAIDIGAIVEVDAILSVVPPSEAASLAKKLAPVLAKGERKPIYVDCNAVNVSTVKRIAAIVEAAGAPFVDAAIIGAPPKLDEAGPTLYFAGPHAASFRELGNYGTAVRIIDGPVGTASALKMSYAGITKGLTAVAAAMVLAASRAGVAEALQEELAASQPQLLARFETALPDMFSKAYRWVAEMSEVAVFAEEIVGAPRIYEGARELYEALAFSHAGTGKEIDVIRAFFGGRRGLAGNLEYRDGPSTTDA